MIKTFKEVALVLFSAFGFNLIVGIFVKKKDNNDLYKQFISEDLLCDKEFIATLPDSVISKIQNAYDSLNYPVESQAYKDMCISASKKINEKKYEYYYKQMAVNIDCEMQSDCIIKNISKTIEIMPFKKTYKIKNFTIASTISNNVLSDEKTLEIEKVTIDNRTIDVNKDLNFHIKDVVNKHQKRSNFNKELKYSLKKPIELTSQKSTKVQIDYVTRTSLNDKTYFGHLVTPCKKFDFEFSFKPSQNDKYTLYSKAFGFLENADETPISNDRYIVKYNFSNWCYLHNGVAIFIDKC